MFQNLLIQEEKEHTHIQIRKQYELGMYLFFLFTLVFIGVMLYWLMPIAKENNPNSSTNTLFIIELIISGVGIIMILGMFFEILKREHIVINSKYLILETRMIGIKIFSQRYFLDSIKEISVAQPALKGWQKTKGYENLGHKEYTTYTKNTKKSFPTICFLYNNKEITFAYGLMTEGSENIITYINKHKKWDSI